MAATATPGTTIHTASSTAVDVITLYAMNTDSTDRKLTIEWGGVTSPDDLIEVTITKEAGLVKVVDALPLQNSLVVKAFAATTNVITILGFVNRIT